MSAQNPIRSIGIVLQDFALGGTERIAARLGRAWATAGVRTIFFCGLDEGPLRPLIGTAEVVAAWPGIARAKGSRDRLGRAAADYFELHPVDAVFVPGNYHWPVVPPLAGIAREVRPVIVAQVSAALRKQQRGPVNQPLFDVRMRWLLRQADGLVTLSELAREQAAAIVGEGPEVRTIASPALDDDLPAPHRAGGNIIMAAGRLVPEKGFATLIEAFALLPDPELELMIVGAGPDEARLRALAEALGVADRLRLPGYQPDIRPYLEQARLYVLSSDFEGYPAVLIEAMAAGLPVVATDCTPATDDLLTSPDFGRVVPVGAYPEMAMAIAKVLDAPAPDPKVLAAAVAHHKLGTVSRAYLDFFAGLR